MNNLNLIPRLTLLVTLTASLALFNVAFAGASTPCRAVETCETVLNQRTVSISKLTCPSASQAILKAEKKNPGWKVVNCKELSKSWSLTLKKEK